MVSYRLGHRSNISPLLTPVMRDHSHIINVHQARRVTESPSMSTDAGALLKLHTSFGPSNSAVGCRPNLGTTRTLSTSAPNYWTSGMFWLVIGEAARICARPRDWACFTDAEVADVTSDDDYLDVSRGVLLDFSLFGAKNGQTLVSDHLLYQR